MKQSVGYGINIVGRQAEAISTSGVMSRFLNTRAPPPLVRETESQDTIIIPINPNERKGIPRAASDILNRLNEVAFNAVLLKELRMIALLRRAADPGHEEGEKWSKMRVHYVSNEVMTKLSASSKLIAEWDFFCLLRDEGRRSAQAFLEHHAEDLGRRSGFDRDTIKGCLMPWDFPSIPRSCTAWR